jgi:hypothetical protein
MPNLNGMRGQSMMQLGSRDTIHSKIKPVASESSKKTAVKGNDPFGFRVSVLALRNYALKRPIKVRVVVYEEFYHERDVGLKYEFSTVYHD